MWAERCYRRRRERSAGEIHRALGDVTFGAVSQHLGVLERAGLIEQGRQAQWRPRRLRAGPLREIADWVDQYRRHWEESFERLDTYLRDLQDSQEPERGDE